MTRVVVVRLAQYKSMPCYSEPDLSARNLLAARGETADSSRDEAALRNDNAFGNKKRCRASLGLDARGRPFLHGSCRLLLAQLFEEKADRLNPAIKIWDVKLLIRRVQVVIG